MEFTSANAAIFAYSVCHASHIQVAIFLYCTEFADCACVQVLVFVQAPLSGKKYNITIKTFMNMYTLFSVDSYFLVPFMNIGCI